MRMPNLLILYVADVADSAAFYADLLGRAPAEQSPGFAMFPDPSGTGLGLWKREAVAPAVTAAPGGAEIAFAVADVEAVHADWSARGLRIAQPPVAMEFGQTFTALDPDGHRLRVYCPAP